jgi:hypothetical protein
VTDVIANYAAAVRPIQVVPDGVDSILGRPDRGAYVVVPPAGAVLVEALQAGEPLPVATARASLVAGAEVDGEDFVRGLAAAGLLEAPPGPAAPRRPSRTREIRWIAGVSPAVARRLFGRVGWSCYGLAALCAVLVLVTRPDLRPSFEHGWWLPDPILSAVLLLPMALFLAACHEVWHWLAGRAAGVPAVFRVSYRGIFLVFETDLTQIVTAPRRRRYGPFLAGMAFDVTVLAAVLVLRLANRINLLALPGLVDRLLAAVVLIELTAIIWQWAALVMRSDGYAVVANALRCHDLYRVTWLTTKDRFWGLTEADVAELASSSDHDRRVARWFGLFFLAGILVMAWMLLRYAIPFVVAMVSFVGHSLVRPSLTSAAFWESVAVVVVTAGQYAAVSVLAWQERRMRRSGVLR